MYQKKDKIIMSRITVSEVKARIATILNIEAPKELDRLKQFIATGTSATVEEAQLLITAAIGDVREAGKKASQGNRPNGAPAALPRDPGLSLAAQGAADMKRAKELGFAKAPTPMSSTGGGNPDRTMRA
jgi:hypothetical protein